MIFVSDLQKDHYKNRLYSIMISTESIEELHNFARKLKLRKYWFKGNCYHLSFNKYNEAIEKGIQELSIEEIEEKKMENKKQIIENKYLSSVSIIELVHKELLKATEKFDSFNSAHEAYSVILEELDELWEEIKKKKENRSKEKLRKEAIQVAAMAVRFVLDVCNEE